jgi:dCMP deaminase
MLNQILSNNSLLQPQSKSAKKTPFITNKREKWASKANKKLSAEGLCMTRPSWDEYFMSIAHAVKARCNCSSPAKGAILVKNKQIISTGYNGTPRGVKNCIDGGCQRCADVKAGKIKSGEQLDKCACSHAEENAIVQAALHGIATEGSTMYTTYRPCTTCAKMIINAGIVRIVSEVDYPDDLGFQLMKEAGIKLDKFVKNQR